MLDGSDGVDMLCEGVSPNQANADEIRRFGAHSECFADDLTGLPLPPDLCRVERQMEIEYFK